MISVIHGLPAGVVGLLAEGDITAADYEQVVIPEMSRATEPGQQVSLLYVLADGVGYDAAAIWKDAKVGMNYLSKVDRMAIVTDDGRYRAAINLVGVFMPGRVQVFRHEERAAAENWVSGQAD